MVAGDCLACPASHEFAICRAAAYGARQALALQTANTSCRQGHAMPNLARQWASCIPVSCKFTSYRIGKCGACQVVSLFPPLHEIKFCRGRQRGCCCWGSGFPPASKIVGGGGAPKVRETPSLLGCLATICQSKTFSVTYPAGLL